MKHKKKYRKLNRSTAQRMAMLRDIVSALFAHDQVKTTLAKAKEARRLADRLITLAKKGDLAARREVLRTINDPDLVGYMFENLADRFMERDGGYTRVIRAGTQRGDGTQMAILELTE
ncbi:MAG: 50S ribosomal protein L17 [Armatimonadota bacterium]